jgi:hypothetical protein
MAGRAKHSGEIKAVDPLVREAIEILRRQPLKETDIALRAGIHVYAIRMWRLGHSPVVRNLLAVLDVLGYELRIVRKEQGK